MAYDVIGVERGQFRRWDQVLLGQSLGKNLDEQQGYEGNMGYEGVDLV